jgi:hypothetical protein
VRGQALDEIRRHGRKAMVIATIATNLIAACARPMWDSGQYRY